MTIMKLELEFTVKEFFDVDKSVACNWTMKEFTDNLKYIKREIKFQVLQSFIDDLTNIYFNHLYAHEPDSFYSFWIVFTVSFQLDHFNLEEKSFDDTINTAKRILNEKFNSAELTYIKGVKK